MSKLKVFDKYSGAELANINMLDSEGVDALLSVSATSFETLKKTSAGERADWLRKLATLLKENHAELSELITSEAGKPISYSKNEVDRSVTTLEFAADECLKFGGEVVPMNYGAGTSKQAYTQRFPIGTVLGIAPFNFPLNLILHKLAPAIAAGNPIIIKPSLYTPLVAFALEQLALEAGFPEGAFQVALCSNELCEKLLLDEKIKVLSFTGSAQVGWELKQKVPKKRVTLELGGNAAVIVDASTDLELAAESIAVGAFLYAGQICISTQQIYVQAQVYDNFLELLLDKTAKLKVGDPHDQSVQVGPIINASEVERITNWVAEAKKSQAKILCGGKLLDKEHNVYLPTLISDAGYELKVVCEEVFGPVAVISKYSNFSDVLSEINKSKYGLQTGVFTNRIDAMKEAFEKLEVGAVIINNIPGFRVDSMPYGGIKDSGFGREGLRFAMEEMTDLKLLVY